MMLCVEAERSACPWCVGEIAMSRGKGVLGAVLAGLALLAASRPAAACGYGMPSPLVRFAQADCVVIGKVETFEERTVEAAQYPGAPQKQTYGVAVLRLSEVLRGIEDLTHLRVGLLQHQTLQLGQEACFFLTPHHRESFFQMTDRYDYPINRQGNPGFEAQMQQYRSWGRLLRDPVAGLQAKNPQDRFLTAALLVSQYRTRPATVPGKQPKAEPIDARESRLILEALAEADWAKAAPDFRVTPQRLFAQLGATPQDGWQPKPFKDMKEYETAVKTWLREHAGTFRIQALTQG
jgi:hypothetical protein